MVDWEKILAAAGAFVVFVGGGVVGWYVLILGQRSKTRDDESKRKAVDAEAESVREQQKLDSRRAGDKQQRNDVNEEAWVLIRQLQAIIETHKKDTANIRKEYEDQLQACEDRDRASSLRIARLERQNGRLIERLQLIESMMSRTKGWNIAPFKEEHDDGSAVHIPIN